MATGLSANFSGRDPSFSGKRTDHLPSVAFWRYVFPYMPTYCAPRFIAKMQNAEITGTRLYLYGAKKLTTICAAAPTTSQAGRLSSSLRRLKLYAPISENSLADDIMGTGKRKSRHRCNPISSFSVPRSIEQSEVAYIPYPHCYPSLKGRQATQGRPSEPTNSHLESEYFGRMPLAPPNV